MKNKETIEKAAQKYGRSKTLNKTSHMLGFIAGAKWQQEQNKNLYSEQDVSEYAYYFESCYAKRPMQKPLTPSEWFEQFKKK